MCSVGLYPTLLQIGSTRRWGHCVLAMPEQDMEQSFTNIYKNNLWGTEGVGIRKWVH